MRILWFLCLGVAVLATADCDDNLFPERPVETDTVTIYSLARPEYKGFPSAYDVPGRARVIVEAAGATLNWDVALTEQGGAPVLLPAGAFPGMPSESGVAMVPGRTFEELREAPRDAAAYEESAPVPIESGRVYAVRSRQIRLFGLGIACRYYAKLQPLSIDQAGGAVRFEIAMNPNCNNRSLEIDED